MSLPLVSVVIPFYSEKKWLIEALESVKRQTYKNYEVIVVNDGSPINIDDLVRKYESINFLYKENGGPSSARNLGIEKSTGKYIAFLDSDDYWTDDKLKKQIEYMEKYNFVWSQHSYKMFWENSDKTKIVNTERHIGDVFLDCYISFKVQTSTVIVLRDVLVQENIFFPLNERYGQDLTFYKKIADKYSLGYIDGVFSAFRIRGKNAGFRATVQLANRAKVYTEIQSNNEIKRKLPNQVVKAYKISYRNFNKYKNYVHENENERLAKIFYLIPYLMFKKLSREV